MSLLAVQLCRHPSLKHVDRGTVWSRHPGVYDSKKGKTVVPAAYDNDQHGPSVFMNPVRNMYGDKLLADGRTIEFHASTNDMVNGKLDGLVGREATLYAFLGNNTYRTGKVIVDTASSRGVYHLRLVSPSLPQAAPPPQARQPQPLEDDMEDGGYKKPPVRVLWADMTDSE